MRSTLRPPTAIAVAVMAGLALALAGCGGGGGAGTGTTPAPVAGTTTPGATSPTTPASPTTPRRATPTQPAPGSPSGKVDPAAVRIVRAWADTLRRGDVRGAAGYFAVPSLVANGSAPVRLTSRALLVAFNASLPCGAILLSTEAAPGGFVIATFRLTERPGAGSCGSGTGSTASTAFRVHDGRIVDWLRVQDLPGGGGGAGDGGAGGTPA